MMLSDLEYDDIQGKLIAYLDGELPDNEVQELEAMLASDESLRGDLEMYRRLSGQLEELCVAEGLSIPDHIVKELQVTGPVPVPPLGKNIVAGNSEKTKPDPALSFSSAKPDIGQESSLPTSSVFAESDNVTELSARRQASEKLNQKQATRSTQNRRAQFFSLQSLSQMAAALALGIFVGPQIFQMPSSKDGLESVGTIQLRSGESLAAIDPQSTANFVTLLALSESGIFERRIDPGDAIQSGTPFVLQFNSPLDGVVRVSEIAVTEGGDLSSEGQQKLIYEGDVTEGDRFALPEKGAFTLSNQERFTLAVTFVGENGRYEATMIFPVE